MGQGETVCVFSSGEKPVWPDGKALDTVSSGEKRVWPDGSCIMLSSVAYANTKLWKVIMKRNSVIL